MSAAESRISTWSYGPRSPSMIHWLRVVSSVWTSLQTSGGFGCRPSSQKCLSSSTTGMPVRSPRRRARVDLPAPPRPRTTIRCTAEVSVHPHANRTLMPLRVRRVPSSDTMRQ